MVLSDLIKDIRVKSAVAVLGISVMTGCAALSYNPRPYEQTEVRMPIGNSGYSAVFTAPVEALAWHQAGFRARQLEKLYSIEEIAEMAGKDWIVTPKEMRQYEERHGRRYYVDRRASIIKDR